MTAALYVDPRGVYSTLPGVECWGLPDRDAREYAGPHPVVAHPPCARWGAFASGGPRYPGSRVPGDDGGCFAAALAAARAYGGVIEHPRGSKAFAAFGLQKPSNRGGWTEPDLWGGRSCQVEQGWYGHPARKPTWLYAVRCDAPALTWGSSAQPDPPDCPFSAEERLTFGKPPKGAGADYRARRRAWLVWRQERGLRVFASPELLCRRAREATPEPFALLLVDIARTARP